MKIKDFSAHYKSIILVATIGCVLILQLFLSPKIWILLPCLVLSLLFKIHKHKTYAMICILSFYVLLYIFSHKKHGWNPLKFFGYDIEHKNVTTNNNNNATNEVKKNDVIKNDTENLTDTGIADESTSNETEEIKPVSGSENLSNTRNEKTKTNNANVIKKKPKPPPGGGGYVPCIGDIQPTPSNGNFGQNIPSNGIEPNHGYPTQQNNQNDVKYPINTTFEQSQSYYDANMQYHNNKINKPVNNLYRQAKQTQNNQNREDTENVHINSNNLPNPPKNVVGNTIQSETVQPAKNEQQYKTKTTNDAEAAVVINNSTNQLDHSEENDQSQNETATQGKQKPKKKSYTYIIKPADTEEQRKKDAKDIMDLLF